MKIRAIYLNKEQIKQYEPTEIGFAVEKEFPDDADMAEEWWKLFEVCKENTDKALALETRLLDAKAEKLAKEKVDVAIDIGQEDE